ncbi:MAG: hypothetical protein R3290_00920 [Acidimicrobiia bacterium]|nr:hypothetical protein [Acidimicrobiia bacterium]
MHATLRLLAQADDTGLDLPDDGAAWIVWLLVAGVIVGLYLVVQRTRERAEREYWERKREEDER